MSSLRQITNQHGPLLLVDAASSRVQAGMLSADGECRWISLDEEAGTGIFRCVTALNVDFGSLGAYLYCEGPGSILGVRTTAAALRSWKSLSEKPAWSYKSIELVAEVLGRSDVAIICDARRDSWHLSRIGKAMTRVSSAELPDDVQLLSPEGFKQWSKLPETKVMGNTSYDLSKIIPRAWDKELFTFCEQPDAFLHEEPFYATWTPQIHRAPS